MLTCEECGKNAKTEEEVRRWRAYLTVVEGSDLEQDAGEEVAVYCQACAEREFGSPPNTERLGRSQ